jgi:hypothetical protein
VKTAAIAVMLASTAARADVPLIARPIALDRGAIDGRLTLETNLYAYSQWKPTSLAPDVWYGVTPDLTVGVVSSADALSQVGTGDGVCFGGIAHGCEQAYSNLGVDARWAIARGEWSVAARVRLVTRRWSPWLPSARLGALARWQRGRFAITGDPQLQLGLDHTDQGNRAQVNVPLWLAVAPTCRSEVYLRTGVYGELAVFGDVWSVPALAGARVAVTTHIDVAAEIGFQRLAGPLDEGKLRVAWLSVAARWP